MTKEIRELGAIPERIKELFGWEPIAWHVSWAKSCTWAHWAGVRPGIVPRLPRRSGLIDVE